MVCALDLSAGGYYNRIVASRVLLRTMGGRYEGQVRALMNPYPGGQFNRTSHVVMMKPPLRPCTDVFVLYEHCLCHHH